MITKPDYHFAIPNFVYGTISRFENGKITKKEIKEKLKEGLQEIVERLIFNDPEFKKQTEDFAKTINIIGLFAKSKYDIQATVIFPCMLEEPEYCLIVINKCILLNVDTKIEKAKWLK